jgi:hypothetical protein
MVDVDLHAIAESLYFRRESGVLVPFESRGLSWKPDRNYCHINADRYALENPDHKAVRGWMVLNYSALGFFRFMAHSVNEGIDGRLFDITPAATHEGIITRANRSALAARDAFTNPATASPRTRRENLPSRAMYRSACSARAALGASPMIDTLAPESTVSGNTPISLSHTREFSSARDLAGIPLIGRMRTTRLELAP